MKKLLLATSIAGLSLALSAPTMAAEDQYEAYQASLSERGDSGVSGTAVFDPNDGKMEMTVEAKNAEGMSVGVHRGVCRYADSGSEEKAPDHFGFKKEPEFPAASFKDGEATATLDITVGEMMGQPRSVAIYDGDTLTACGNIQ
ncbi:MAG: hypothetical protein JXJ30_08025 [Halothiobacillaceae bacterium]|nr:hypothetical protein [Halothiobacillaceae bacterium]HER35593.1 hypothetical protein [Halothiobacillaceae bacterium]